MLVTPVGASAHEKWFVDAQPYPVRWELLFSLPTVVAVAVSALMIGALVLLRRIVRDPYFPNPQWLRPVNPAIQAVVGIQTAISLVFMTGHGWLLAPTLSVPQNVIGWALLAVQLFLSFTFITGWFTRLGGAVLVALVGVAFLLFPPTLAAEQLLFAGIGLYMLIEGRALYRPYNRLARRAAMFWSRYSHLSLTAMRVGTGLSILWLAFSEKLLNPQLGLAFLQQYPQFNFMKLLGFTWYSDELFVYSAGVVEATVGVLLVSGVLPRVVILLMWLPFNIAIPLLPPQELLGHLPILAVMYAVFLGSDRSLPPADEMTASDGHRLRSETRAGSPQS
jgi:uncharacterized membrane protein YphA (DoxX/SURF4 family)